MSDDLPTVTVQFTAEELAWLRETLHANKDRILRFASAPNKVLCQSCAKKLKEASVKALYDH